MLHFLFVHTYYTDGALVAALTSDYKTNMHKFVSLVPTLSVLKIAIIVIEVCTNLVAIRIPKKFSVCSSSS